MNRVFTHYLCTTRRQTDCLRARSIYIVHSAATGNFVTFCPPPPSQGPPPHTLLHTTPQHHSTARQICSRLTWFDGTDCVYTWKFVTSLLAHAHTAVDKTDVVLRLLFYVLHCGLLKILMFLTNTKMYDVGFDIGTSRPSALVAQKNLKI